MPQPRRALLIAPKNQVQNFLPPPLFAEIQALLPALGQCDPRDLEPEKIEALLTEFDPEILITGWELPPLPLLPPPSLRYVCHLGGTVRDFLPRSYLEKEIRLTNWGNSISKTVAEMALLLILNCLRQTRKFDHAMRRDKAWPLDHAGNQTLFGKKVGLHGFGKIARELIKLLKPFDVSISSYSEPVPEAVFESAGVRSCLSLDALFSENDIVVELEGLTPQSRSSVQLKHFSLMREGSVFVNVGRGAVVDETALIESAREGKIRFGLDVFHEEPLPSDHPLRELENVCLYPHIAGPTPDYAWKAGELALANLRAYLHGEEFTDGSVDCQAYDRQT